MNCLKCNKRSYSEYCYMHKPGKLIQVKRPMNISKTGELKHWKRPKKIGKEGERWSDLRRQWLVENSPNCPCHYCGVRLSYENLTLDHRIPRSRAPHLRYEMSNLVPCCFTCNGLKGSVAHDDYQHNCPDTTKEVTT